MLLTKRNHALPTSNSKLGDANDMGDYQHLTHNKCITLRAVYIIIAEATIFHCQFRTC